MKSGSKISGRNFHGYPGHTRMLSIMYRLAIIILCVIFISGCSCARTQTGEEDHVNLTGRQRVLKTLNPSRLCVSFFGRSGLLSTALPSSRLSLCKPLRELDPKGSHGGRPFSMTLADGTIAGGLFFEYDDGTTDPKPLLMASFGFLQDRWGTEAAKFYNLYLKDPSERIPAHVLILDHPSAGTFLANNGHLSVGSYDDARMWIEIAQGLKNDLALSGIHLFGVSMSGQTVVHALIEDKRLGKNLFASGIAVSIAPDFHQAPGKQLAQLKTPRGIENPWAEYYGDVPCRTLIDMIQSQALWMMVKEQFIPHYRLVRPTDKEFKLRSREVAVFFRQAFEDRITYLRDHGEDTWNREDMSLEDLDAFMASTRIARVIGRVHTPLVLVSAFDDPAVQRTMFVEVAQAAESNPWIAAFETDQGGHFGFNMPYGKDYISGIIRLMMDPQVLGNWNGP
jgi:hypothetical protein